MNKVLKENYAEHLPVDKNAAILDFGCGNGRVLKFLDQLGYNNILGVDIDEEAINAVPDNLKEQVKCLENPIDYLREKKNQFECIILKDVIYYFPREQVVDKCKDIINCLKPGGIAIVEVFNGAQLTALYTGFKDVGIQTVYTETSLRQICELCNLEVQKIFELKTEVRGLKSVIYYCAQFIWKNVLKSIYILERGLDNNNPRLLNKSIIAICRKK